MRDLLPKTNIIRPPRTAVNRFGTGTGIAYTATLVAYSFSSFQTEDES
jgi:hypothetical protein